jgi:hypothetical protein
MKKKYKKDKAEKIRIFLRVVDLMLLYWRFGINSLGKIVLVEFGPGPTKLNRIKKLYFKRICYIDTDDFGEKQGEVIVYNLEQYKIEDVLALAAPNQLIVMGDHCIEHISYDVVRRMLFDFNLHGIKFLFRVPNVESQIGLRNFNNDSTHRTAFNKDQRLELGPAAHFIPYSRFYRLSILSKMNNPVFAEEIVVTNI